MVLVEHDLAMVAEVVDRTVVMNLGEVIAEGDFDAVMADPAVRQAYLGVRRERPPKSPWPRTVGAGTGGGCRRRRRPSRWSGSAPPTGPTGPCST